METEWFVVILLILLIILANIIFIYFNYHKQRPKNRISIPFYDVLRKAKTGDLLLFRSNFRSWTQPYFFGDEFSHVGLVFDSPKDKQKYVFEAVAQDNLSNINVGEPTSGVHITPLYTRMRHYDGTIVWRPLNKPLTPNKLALFEEAVEDLLAKKFLEVYNMQTISEYTKNCILLLPATKRQLASVHCSQAVAIVLERAGIMEFDGSDLCVRPQCLAEEYKHFKSTDGYAYSTTGYQIELPR